MGNMVTVIKGKLLTREMVISLAASAKGLKTDHSIGQRMLSKSIASFTLDNALMKLLTREGYSFIELKNGIFSMVDPRLAGHDGKLPIADYWSFEKNDERKFDLRADMKIVPLKRGVLFSPLIIVVGSWPSLYQPAHEKLWKFFARLAEEVNIIQWIVGRKNEPVIEWHEIHLAGVRKINDLFEEFRQGSKQLEALGSTVKISPFDPSPEEYSKWFLPEPWQPTLFELWKKQLLEYVANLSL